MFSVQMPHLQVIESYADFGYPLPMKGACIAFLHLHLVLAFQDVGFHDLGFD
jgi:hypothetical protein